ncbi:MAG: exodeoxyribonuclease VII large subunit [bacterium]
MKVSEDDIYSVPEITRAIKKLIKEGFTRLKVRGEIADFTHYSGSGHMYITLAGGEARLSAVMFRRANRNLDFDPEEGMDVVAEGRLDVYEGRGSYQLIVETMRPEGRGELEKEFIELKNKLEKEGVLAEELKKDLPDFPGTIGVVTSGDGAAFSDIVRAVRRRCPVVKIILYPSRVNSREAAPEIARAIRRFPEIADLDCMIVGRGGGSPEDLWAFNTEEVARAILDCSLPVVSAVGHEVDVTIADLVADHRSPTPTAAGGEVVPDLQEITRQLDELARRLKSGMQNKIDRLRERVRYKAEKPIYADPRGWLKPFREQLDRFQELFQHYFKNNVTEARSRVKSYRDRLEALNPENVLNRGFTLVESAAGIITSSQDVNPGEQVNIKWSDGEHKAQVEENN